MKIINELFSVFYGNKFDLNKMKPRSLAKGGVNFVGRSSQNQGVSGTVERLPGVEPYTPGLITVALGGTKLLSSFIQEQPFYTAQNVAVLSPKFAMTFAEKLYMCICIRHNRFRYSAFGREANRTLRFLLVPNPSEFPLWIKNYISEAIEELAGPAKIAPLRIRDPQEWKKFSLASLFTIKKGKRLTKARMTKGETPFIGSTDKNNGVSTYISEEPIHAGNTISVNYNGSVAEAFYQEKPFWASDDVNVLYPKFKLTQHLAIFLVTIIRAEKYRFNYGRKWHLDRMKESIIKLPADKRGEPDWRFMENYIKSLPYSKNLN